MPIEAIQKLRDMTGAGVMECKKALEDAKGDFDAALKLISERGAMKVEKRAERETGAGILETYIHNGRVGVLLELRSETDFVAHSEKMKELAHRLVMQIAAMEPENLEALLAQPFIQDESKTVGALITDVIAVTGENVRVGKFYRIQI